MAILNILPTFFRNLHSADIEFHSHLNFITGENASGKTSLLEAVYFLSTGKSFRSRRISNIINRHSESKEFIIFGCIADCVDLNTHTVGIRKSEVARTELKLDGEFIRSASRLALISPVVVIDPDSFELLTGAPKIRRKFLDWGVFHVEHSFSKLSNDYNNCLKQRNTLLRAVKIDKLQLDIWDQKLASIGEEIHEKRSSYAQALLPILHSRLAGFLDINELDIKYAKGWEKESSLLSSLSRHQAKDIEKKFTQFGAHRADLKVTIKGRAIEDILSRGQQKLLVIALYLAQIQYLCQAVNKRTVVLIDDISAELDDKNIQRIFVNLAQLETQVICTALNIAAVKTALPANENYKMFHVEHGTITAIE